MPDPPLHDTSVYTTTLWSHSYSYDNVGNRTAKDSVTYTINTVNEVTGLSDGTSFTYDANGNRTQKTKGTDTWVYTYDDANRLTTVEKNSTTLGEYIYDGDGKRIKVTENNETTTYIYSGVCVLFEENSTGTAVYIHGPTGRLAKRTTIQGETHTYFYHDDHLGSTRLVTDENKAIVTAVTYHPFGGTFTEEGSEDYLFTGGKRDATGLYYYSARYYDHDLGRFITRDPLKGSLFNPQSLNRYTYCFNNPLKFVDPLGLGATFSDEEAQKAYEEQTGGGTEEETGDSSTDEEEYEFVNYELLTGIERQGNVGVAVAKKHSFNLSNIGSMYNSKTEYGLMIFYYDGDEIIDQIFIPFDKLENVKTIKTFKKIKNFLRNPEDDLENLGIALDKLERELFEKAAEHGDKGYFGGGVLGLRSIVAGVLIGILSGGALAAIGIFYGGSEWATSSNLTKWAGLVDNLEGLCEWEVKKKQ